MATIKGIWVFNDSIVALSNGVSYAVNFTSNGNTYNQFVGGYTAKPYGDYVAYDNTVVYGINTGWTDTTYKTIEITSEPTDEAFITWLKANATQQATEETNGVTIEYNGSIVATVEGGNKATLPVKDKQMVSDIVVTVPVAEGGTDSAIPIEVATEAEMTALLTSGEVGGVYKYTGTTGTYENGALYVLENATITFTFSISGGSSYECQAEEGMTIGEWIESDYNTIGATLVDNYPYIDSRQFTSTPSETVITDGAVYTAMYSGGSG